MATGDQGKLTAEIYASENIVRRGSMTETRADRELLGLPCSPPFPAR
jgi:hypothetical protein